MPIKDGNFFPPVIVLFLTAAVTLWSCAQKGGKSASGEDGQILKADFAGRISAITELQSATPSDSLKLLQLAYQSASFSSQLYQLQNAIVRAYFYACDQRCEIHQCSPGNIIAAAMSYLLDNNADSANDLCSLINSKIQDTPVEVREIKEIIEFVIDNGENSELMPLYFEGRVKSTSGIAFLAVLNIDRGPSPDYWIRSFEKKTIDSDSPSIRSVYAYALAGRGEIIKAFEALPDYPPLAKQYPLPAFIEPVRISDSIYTQNIFLPVDLYIRKSIDALFFRRITDIVSGSSDVEALKALARVKNFDSFKADHAPISDRVSGTAPSGASEEIVYAISLATDSETSISERLESLKNPVARAAFFKYLTASSKQTDVHTTLLDKEIDNSRKNDYWESKILLSEAMIDAFGDEISFRKMSNFGILDLSVRNNPPEWLAIYARVGLAEGSQVALVTRIVFNLTQHYPYAVGLYEIIQSYNHLCKYY